MSLNISGVAISEKVQFVVLLFLVDKIVDLEELFSVGLWE